MVDWTSLHHAYGAAGDLPALLNSLTPDPADEVWGELWSRICHQGSVYSASFAALPALADAAGRWQPNQRAQPLALAGCILASGDCRDNGDCNLVEAFFQENRSVIRRFQELCQESLAQRDLPQEDFICLLQAARSFNGDKFWGAKARSTFGRRVLWDLSALRGGSVSCHWPVWVLCHGSRLGQAREKPRISAGKARCEARAD